MLTEIRAIVDDSLRPKLAYYAIKRELAPFTVGMKRTMATDTDESPKTVDAIELWGSNLSLKPCTIEIIVRGWDIRSGEQILPELLRTNIRLEANRSVEISTFNLPTVGRNRKVQAETVVVAYALQARKIIARAVNWPEPLKYVHLPTPKRLSVQISERATHLAISADVPVKGVVIEIEDENVVLDDNGVDIVPGDVTRIAVSGLKTGDDGKVRLRYLGMKCA